MVKQTQKPTAAILGRRLRRLRGDRSQGEIGAQAHMKQTQYSRYESGGSWPGSAVLKRLADALGTTVEELTRPATEDELYDLEVADLQKEATEAHARINEETNTTLIDTVKNLSGIIGELQKEKAALLEEVKELRRRLHKYEGGGQ